MPIDIEALRAVRVIVTHQHSAAEACPDGLASACIIRRVLPEARVLFMQHGTPELRDLVAEPWMLFCDITPPAARVAEFVEVGAIVLDHHKTARAVVEAFGERGVFADEETEPGVSGAVLAFREVWAPLYTAGGAHAMADFARLAGIRDTWQRGSPDWTEACAQAEALRFWPRETWLNALPTTWEMLLGIGPVLLQKREQAVDAALAGAYRFTSAKGTRVCMFSGLDCTSDASEKADADLVVGFLYFVDSTGVPRLSFSLRGRGGFDCASFAKCNGGGGHTSAAGFQVMAAGNDPYTKLASRLEHFEYVGTCAS
jgi:hypothetical protein